MMTEFINGDVGVEYSPIQNVIENQKVKVVCFADDGAFEFHVLEKASIPLYDVHEFIKSKFNLHKNAKWLLLPHEIEISETE